MITPVLLAGGAGTRLWPLSRKSYPKQFSPILGNSSLFQKALARFTTGKHVSFRPPVILTNSGSRFIVTEQLEQAGIDPGAILIEPSRRNTGPAILAAALYLMENDPDTVMLVAPSDHLLPDRNSFHSAIQSGLHAVKNGRIVTFGIIPTRADTGFGYLEIDACPNGDGPLPLRSFVEKPPKEQASEMYASGKHLWNAGIFMFSPDVILKAYAKHAAGLLSVVERAVNNARPDLGFLRLDENAWRNCEDISIDYAVMEKADNISVIPYSGKWSDLGGWDAVWKEGPADRNGVSLSGTATGIDCRNTLLRSEDEHQEIVGIGLNDIMAIAMPDAVLVADMNRSQDVKRVIATLKAKNAPQATTFPKEHRPWGWFEVLVQGDKFKVKRISMHPGAAISLQSHMHRSEHWVVVEGQARVTIGEYVSTLKVNQSAYIPAGAIHRLENIGKQPMVLIEVQTGDYLEEDDITRFEDIYARTCSSPIG